MSKSNGAENGILALIFNAADWANMARDTATSPATTLTVALHTADPLSNEATGTQLTSETPYTGYARVAVNRNSGGWTVSVGTGTVSPASNIDFGECSNVNGSTAITHFSIGTGTSNAILYAGTVTPNISIAVGVIPRLKTTSTITED